MIMMVEFVGKKIILFRSRLDKMFELYQWLLWFLNQLIFFEMCHDSKVKENRLMPSKMNEIWQVIIWNPVPVFLFTLYLPWMIGSFVRSTFRTQTKKSMQLQFSFHFFIYTQFFCWNKTGSWFMERTIWFSWMFNLNGID